TVLNILGMLVDDKRSESFDCESGVDSQHLRGLGFRLLNLSRLGIGQREPKMRPLLIGQARYALAEQTHRLVIALEHVMSGAQVTCRIDERLKRIEAHVCLQYLYGPCRLARKRQGSGVCIVDEIWIEREGALKFRDRSVVPALVDQDTSKLSVSLRQAGV